MPQTTAESHRRVRNYGAITSAQQDNDDVNNIESTRNESIGNSSSDSSGTSISDVMKPSLTFIQKFGFGFGHVYNDLCAGVWFSYVLLFMQRILLIPSKEAGALVMLGQVADAISTPIVGLLMDKYLTKRKWYIFGTGLVFVTFPLIFSICPGCNISNLSWWPPLYLAGLFVVFQFGWAVVQISHLSMIPEVSGTNKDRADLTATRYSASVISNLIVYVITWIAFHGRDKKENTINPADGFRFRNISLALTVVGVIMSVLFHVSLSFTGYERRRLVGGTARQTRVEESKRPLIDGHEDDTETDRRPAIQTTETEIVQPQTRRSFLRMPLLYQNTFLYVFSRLFVTTALVYMPLWLDERSWAVTQMNNAASAVESILGISSVEQIAIVPLVSFTASFIASMALKHLSIRCNQQLRYFFGSILSINGCLWVALGTSNGASDLQLYGIAVLFGAGSSVTMISSLCITADMIGVHTHQGGFIYSAVTFADKLITGIVVVIIETLKCKRRRDCPEYYRNVLAYACGVAAILGLVTLFTLSCTRNRINR